NARVKLDGFEVELPDNQDKDLIPGLTLDLKQAAPGRQVNISVKENLEVVSGKVKTFVESVNEVLSFIQNQNKMSEKTDTTKTLGGDSILRSIEQRLHRVMQNTILGVGGDITRLSQLGIAFNRNGTLDFDQQKFTATLASAPKSVQAFLAGDGFNTGFIPVLKREIGTILDTGFGPLGNRKRGLENRITSINNQIDNKERQLARKEESLRRQFSALEEKMSKLNSQGSAVGAIGASTAPPAPKG
ncbi:MAG: flagellar filament capping protein FliD, partial [Pseudobdellovibrionaceae bacterium]